VMAHPNDYGLREEIAFQRRVYSFEPWVNRFPKNILAIQFPQTALGTQAQAWPLTFGVLTC